MTDALNATKAAVEEGILPGMSPPMRNTFFSHKAKKLTEKKQTKNTCRRRCGSSIRSERVGETSNSQL